MGREVGEVAVCYKRCSAGNIVRAALISEYGAIVIGLGLTSIPPNSRAGTVGLTR